MSPFRRGDTSDFVIISGLGVQGGWCRCGRGNIADIREIEVRHELMHGLGDVAVVGGIFPQKELAIAVHQNNAYGHRTDINSQDIIVWSNFFYHFVYQL